MSLLLLFTGKAVSARRGPYSGAPFTSQVSCLPLQSYSLALSSPFCSLPCADLQGPINEGSIPFWLPVGIQSMGAQQETGGREQSGSGCLFMSDVHSCGLSKGLHQPPASLRAPLSSFSSLGRYCGNSPLQPSTSLRELYC